MTSTSRDEAIIFGGRIRAEAGDAIVGAKIEILSRNTRRTLASSISIEGGSYRVRVFRRSEDSNERALTIRALSGSGKLLVTRSVPVVDHETVTDLVVSPDRLKNFRPAAQFLQRLTGSIMDPEALTSLESAIRLINPNGEAGHERLARVIRRAVPPLARFDSVLQDAWEVLEGDLDAAQRLRRALTFLANTERTNSNGLSAPPPVRGEGEFGLRDLAYRAMPTTPLPNVDQMPFRPSICPLPTNRLVPIMAAALRIATDAEDAAVLLDGLDTGLRGMNAFESLTKLGQAALSSGNNAPFEDELARLSAEFGLDSDSALGDGLDWPFPPPGPPPPQTLEPCGRWTRECFGNLIEDWRLQAGIRDLGLATAYRITSVTRSDACPGETVDITGVGFGSIPGQVVFPHRDGQSSIAVDPVAGTWTGTSISVVVPAEAGSGTLRLLIQDALYELIWTCEGPLAVYAQGTGGAFVGGAPFVSSVTIDGKRTGAVVAPDSQFTVAWKASPSSQQVSVFIYESPPNNQFPRNLLLNSFMRASDTITLRTFPRPFRGELHVEVTAPFQRCGFASSVEAVADIDVATKSLRIEGVEVTQGIQVFSLQSPRNSRNTLMTIEGKDTIVRVYIAVDAGSTFSSYEDNVTGVLLIDRDLLYPINGITPGNPQGSNPFITARSAVDIDRRQTNHTLNFRIPAAVAKDVKTLRLLVWGPGPTATRRSAFESMSWQWQPKVAVQVRFVRVQDARPASSGGTGTIPTEAQARYTLQRAFDLLPSPATNIAPAWYDIHVFNQGDVDTLLTDLVAVRQQPDPATGTPDLTGWIALTDAEITPGLYGKTATVITTPTYNDRDHQGPFRIAAAHEITHWRAGACHTNGGTQMCAGHAGSPWIDDVIFDPYWNEAVFPTLSHFISGSFAGGRFWTLPAVWEFLRRRL